MEEELEQIEEFLISADAQRDEFELYQKNKADFENFCVEVENFVSSIDALRNEVEQINIEVKKKIGEEE